MKMVNAGCPTIKQDPVHGTNLHVSYCNSTEVKLELACLLLGEAYRNCLILFSGILYSKRALLHVLRMKHCKRMT